jgi:putative transposase
MEGAAEVFRRGKGGMVRSEEDLTGPLYEEIGRLKVEVDWLKKKL